MIRFGSSASARSSAALESLEHLLSAIRVGRVIVIALAEFRPGRGVVRVQFDSAFQTLDGLSIGGGVVGQGYAAQIKLVGFLIVGPGAGLQKAAGRAQHGQQTLTDLLGQLLLQADQVFRGTRKIGLPQQPSVPVSIASSVTRRWCPCFRKCPVRSVAT